MAVLPALGYFAAYRYATGFLSYFGVQETLVAVSLEGFFKAFGVLLGGLWAIIVIINTAILIMPKSVRENASLFWTMMLLVVMVLLQLVFWTGWAAFVFVLLIVGVFSIPDYILPAFDVRGGSYTERLRRSLMEDSPIVARSLFGSIARRIGIAPYVAIVATLLFVPAVATMAGKHSALMQKEFMSASIEGDRFLLLGHLGERGVFVKASDLAEDKMERQFLVRNLEDESVGILTPYKLSKSGQ